MEVGKVAESVLKRSVLKYVQLNNKHVNASCHLLTGAKVGADSAVFEGVGSKLVATTQTSIGRHRMVVVEALINACNNMWASGAEPFGVEISLVLPEALYESELRHMMEEASNFATKQEMLVLGGHTTVSKDVTETIATVTVIGKIGDFVASSIKAGMEVVVSKWIGLQGTAKIATQECEKLEARLPKRFVAKAKDLGQYMSVKAEAMIVKSANVCAMHDVSGGGIFRALWELAELAGTGIRVDLKKIPVKQETIEVCEVFGLNPYELLSGGALLMVADNGEELVQKLLEANIPATVIGCLTDNKDKVLVTYGEDGEELRYLDKPKSDEIDKIL